jgi:hypothetical protein
MLTTLNSVAGKTGRRTPQGAATTTRGTCRAAVSFVTSPNPKHSSTSRPTGLLQTLTILYNSKQRLQA